MIIAAWLALICGCSGRSSNSLVPDAVVDREYFDVGKLVVGQSARREFTITNQGNAILKLGTIKPTEGHPDCKVDCNLSVREISPGGSAIVQVNVTPRNPWTKLRKGVYIETNDPDVKWLRIGIYAVVAPVVEIETENEQRNPSYWTFETGSDGEPIPIRADVSSAGLDHFEILRLETTPDFTCRYRKLDEVELSGIEGRSGYKLTVEFANQEYVGTKRGRIQITTDAPCDSILAVRFKATRLGPVRIVPDPKSPWRWDHEHGYFALNSFPAAKGATALARVFFSQSDHTEWTIDSVECDIPGAAVSIVETTLANANRIRRFELTLTIPPTNLPVSRGGGNAAQLTIRTTHPKARLIRLPIQYVSTG